MNPRLTGVSCLDLFQSSHMPLGCVFGREIECYVGLTRVIHWIEITPPFSRPSLADQPTINKIRVQFYVVLGTGPTLNRSVRSVGDPIGVRQVHDRLFSFE